MVFVEILNLELEELIKEEFSDSRVDEYVVRSLSRENGQHKAPSRGFTNPIFTDKWVIDWM